MGRPDFAAGRLSSAELAVNFADAHPPLAADQALVEASRCYFCYDAPCLSACPTGIDIPGFIRKIATGNLKGSAMTILEANILGGSCARVCPTEILCEQACVREAQEGKPVNIGALQRVATDWLMERQIQPFTRAPLTGKRVAVVGAGPAGLACAHRLARHGHDVVIYDALPKPGGLTEYGIAAYKVPDEFAQREVAFILGIGGITLTQGKALGRDLTLDGLRRDFDAVFLGLGHAAVNALGLEGTGLAGIADAVAFIAALRQAADKAVLPVGRRVVVIGGGNTAIDAATQAKRLGAEDVTIVYRRGPAEMSATAVEQDWAKTNGVRIKHWAQPVRLLGEAGQVTAVAFERTRLDAAGKLAGTGEIFTLEADMVLSAVGQKFLGDPLGGMLTLAGGRIAVDGDRRTSLPDVYAGGDCIAGPDLTVAAVEDGKIAAEAIHRRLSGG
jgi:glutamate synthase (NADPH/NADH) small chain